MEQLFREVWRRPPGLAPETTSVDTYAGGVFKELRFLHGRVTQLGYRSRGGYAVCPVVEDGATAEARIWIGEHDGYDEYGTETGPWAGPTLGARADGRRGRSRGVVGGHADGGGTLRRP